MPTSENCYKLHDDAVKRGQDRYLDPESGQTVHTEKFHTERGHCCGCVCRHCPYAHNRVPERTLARKMQVPTILNPQGDITPDCDVLCWSGGKDCFLSLLYLRREMEALGVERDIVLLTTVDGHSRMVAHQGIKLTTLEAQAKHLGVALIAVPLFQGVDFISRVDQALGLAEERYKLQRLVFGDLHQWHIRSGRESQFAQVARRRKMNLHFPLWKRSYTELMTTFERSGATARLTTAPLGDHGGSVKVGELFSQNFVDALPSTVDAFGENGEFHTCVSWR